MRKLLVSVCSSLLLLAFGLVGAPPASAAAIRIGVAPSPNGLVMAGVPTQIAVAGTPSAVVFLWDAEQKKYFRIGQATRKAALPYTFQKGGVQRISVRPARGKAKVFSIPVYTRASGFGGTTPTDFGGVVLPSDQTIGYYLAGSADDGITRTVTGRAAEGCVLVDIGAKTDADAINVTVRSTGADPVTVVATKGAPISLMNVPVKGDFVVEFKYQGRAHGNWSQPKPGVVGVMRTCLTPG